MTKARIYQPDKNAMQSGKAKDDWLLEFAPAEPYFSDSLMGWNGMTDMAQEIKLKFPSKEAAVTYAERQGIAYELDEPSARSHVKKAYADNFKFGKITG